jgi:hypothetical protein
MNTSEVNSFSIQRKGNQQKARVELTYRRFLIVGLLMQVIGIKLGHSPERFRLILVQFQSISVERMFDSILLELVVGAQGVEMLQRLREPAEVVVDLEMSTELG